MAAYAQFGCGYPTANQFLISSNGDVPLVTLSSPSSSTPLGLIVPSSLSPHSMGRDSGGGGGGGGCGAVDVGNGSGAGGELTPDPVSQTSATAASSGTTTGSVSSSGSTGLGPDSAGSPYASLATSSTLCVGGGSVDGGSGGHDNTSTSLPATALASAPPPPPCCDNGRPLMTDPLTGQSVCSCQYPESLNMQIINSYTRIQSVAAGGVGVYGPASAAAAAAAASASYPSTEQGPYPNIVAEGGVGPFYTSLSNPYALKDSNSSGGDVSAWTSAGLQPTASYYTYDPTFGAYGYGAGYDLASRRKNATRESTATLKAWLSEHKKNPYPTKGEKIMLAIITKMTLTQVSTWFANARRRLKKENKMTWEPKNRTEDDDDEMTIASDEEKERNDQAMHLAHPHSNNSNNNHNTTSSASTATAATTTTNGTSLSIVGGVGGHDGKRHGFGAISAMSAGRSNDSAGGADSSAGAPPPLTAARAVAPSIPPSVGNGSSVGGHPIVGFGLSSARTATAVGSSACVGVALPHPHSNGSPGPGPVPGITGHSLHPKATGGAFKPSNHPVTSHKRNSTDSYRHPPQQQQQQQQQRHRQEPQMAIYKPNFYYNPNNNSSNMNVNSQINVRHQTQHQYQHQEKHPF